MLSGFYGIAPRNFEPDFSLQASPSCPQLRLRGPIQAVYGTFPIRHTANQSADGRGGRRRDAVNKIGHF